MSSADLLANEINKRAANLIKQKLSNCWLMFYQQEIIKAMMNPIELFRTIQNHSLILQLGSLTQVKREETNEEFWLRIIGHALRDIFSKNADMQSEHLVNGRGVPLILKRNLEADFQCSNCNRRWDSTHVNVKAHYDVYKSTRNGVLTLQGRITLHEINRQRCQMCEEVFEFPIYTEASASSFAQELRCKVLQKYYGENPVMEANELDRRARNQPHDTSNCEGCLMEECISAQGRDSSTRTQTQETERIFNTDPPQNVNWTLEVYGKIMTLG